MTENLLRRLLQTCLFLSLLVFGNSLQAQERTDTTDVLQAQAPKVFIDCQFCDESYIRTEITFVNYVRDRLQADVHVLITTQRTAAGGQEYTVTFIGQNNAAGIHDTLTFTTNQSDTQDMIRSALVRVLKIGLARYAAKTPLGEYLSVSYKRPGKVEEVVDKWNYWIFRVNLNINFNGEKAQQFTSLYGGISAQRVTNDWKISFSLNANYNESSFDLGTSKVLSVSRGQNFDALIVKSMSDHWSVGGFASAGSSTFSNTTLSLSLSPAVEYNIYPYSESTRRQLRILYKIGHQNVRYMEETIFDKTSERLFNQSLSVTLDLRQPWGTVSTSLTGSHYLHDFEKKRLTLYTNLSLRLWEGLSVNLFASYSRLNDQLSLRKGATTPEQILLRRTQLATSYQYYGFIGLSYTFGAIYNNIVNPRFGGSGGSVFSFSF